MRTRIVIPLALIGLFFVGSAYAMTNTQAENLYIQAGIGNVKDLSKLEAMAKSGNAVAERYLGGYWSIKQDSAKTIYWYGKAAEQGNAEAEYFLGLRYAQGRGVPKDYVKANYWFKKAAAQGGSAGWGAQVALASEHPYAITNSQAEHLAKAAFHGNIEDLLKLKISARSGNAAAQMWWGGYWKEKKDYGKAIYWLERAADQEVAQAEYNLGVIYAKGQGVPQNYVKANYWYEKAADQGYAQAEYNLGVAYDNGYGEAQDYAKAIYWYKKAADQGVTRAEFNLGSVYYHGWGVPQDYAKAIYWYKKAVDQGYAPAELELGVAYDHGWGVPQDYMKAIYWYKKAVDQGDALAAFFLGIAYYKGQGVSQDSMTAITWWKKAAAQGGPVGKWAQQNINMAESG